MKSYDEWKVDYIRNIEKWERTKADIEELLKRIYRLEKENSDFKRRYEMWNDNCICDSCKHCHCVGDGMEEPFCYECSEESDQIGFDDGCYRYEYIDRSYER